MHVLRTVMRIKIMMVMIIKGHGNDNNNINEDKINNKNISDIKVNLYNADSNNFNNEDLSIRICNKGISPLRSSRILAYIVEKDSKLMQFMGSGENLDEDEQKGN